MEEMHETMIKNWNSVVEPKQTVFYLGDFTFSNNLEEIEGLLSRLNGKIFLIKGNHDSNLVRKLLRIKQNLYEKFLNVEWYHCTTLQSQGKNYDVVMMHFPIETWEKKHYDSIHCHGHVHNRNPNPITAKNRYNVGVDVNDYTPISFDSIVRELCLRN